MSNKLNTLDSVATEIKRRIKEVGDAMEHAEADGNSDYDYYQGVLEAYECVDGMLATLLGRDADVEVCARCSTPVVFENVSQGYYAACPQHDEDLYQFEVKNADGCERCGYDPCAGDAIEPPCAPENYEPFRGIENG